MVLAYASYFEDIQKRLSESLWDRSCRGKQTSEQHISTVPLSEIQKFVRMALDVELRALLDLVTEPQLDFAVELAKLRTERDRLSQKVRLLESSKNFRKSEVTKLKEKLRSAEVEQSKLQAYLTSLNAKWHSDLTLLKAENERLKLQLANCFGEAVDKYPPSPR